MSNSTAAQAVLNEPVPSWDVSAPVHTVEDLQSLCCERICDEPGLVCEPNIYSGNVWLVTSAPFSNFQLSLSPTVSDQLFATFSKKEKLKDNTLKLFTKDRTSLENVFLSNYYIEGNMLKDILSQHQLRKLVVHNVEGPIGSVLYDVHQLSRALTYLHTLQMSKIPAEHLTSRDNLLTLLTVLRNISTLSLDGLVLRDYNLRKDDAFDGFKDSLQHLNLSRSLITTFDWAMKFQNLATLKLQDCPLKSAPLGSLAYALPHLVSLDLSKDAPRVTSGKDHFFLQDFSCTRGFPALQYLDVSGYAVSTLAALAFVDSHPRLRFLGLFLADASFCMELSRYKVGNDSNDGDDNDDDDDNDNDDDVEHMLIDGATPEEESKEKLTVTGLASLSQILVSLKYYKHRKVYVEKCLQELFTCTIKEEQRPRMIVLAIECMGAFPESVPVHMSATACLFNWTIRDRSAEAIPMESLNMAVNAVLCSMRQHPECHDLQRNSLLLLCNDRVLQSAHFSYFECCTLAMDCLSRNLGRDDTLERMCVAIVSIVAAKMTTMQTSIVGSNVGYVRVLLESVRSKVRANPPVINSTLKFALGALWNLTDESPSACSCFIQADGQDLYLHCFSAFEDKPLDERVQVDVKLVGLLNNIAEVPSLRGRLANYCFLSRIMGLLNIYKDHMEVPYFAAGIVCNIFLSTNIIIDALGSSEQILDELYKELLQWNHPDHDMVAYRSLRPFYPLMSASAHSATQYWSIWAITHVCKRNPDKYVSMFEREQGIPILEDLISAPRTAALVKRSASVFLLTIKKWLQKEQ